jgi:two-component system cell cycle response regulator DivK
MSNILIAEDNAVNRELLRELLETRGHTVTEACDGQEALQSIAQSQPQLVLLDIGMPVLDGFAVVNNIRKDPRTCHLPVLAITAYAMQGDREKILDTGFDGYLSKPIDASLLFQEIDRLLAGRDQHAEGRPKVRVAQNGQ